MWRASLPARDDGVGGVWWPREPQCGERVGYAEIEQELSRVISTGQPVQQRRVIWADHMGIPV